VVVYGVFISAFCGAKLLIGAAGAWFCGRFLPNGPCQLPDLITPVIAVCGCLLMFKEWNHVQKKANSTCLHMHTAPTAT
jgi:hypothetical protein